ncbi:MAG: TolC family protein [Bacillota bacterium]
MELYKRNYNQDLDVNLASDYNLKEDAGWLKQSAEVSNATQLTVTKNFSEDSKLVLSQELLQKNSKDKFELEGTMGALTYKHYILQGYDKSTDYKNGLFYKKIALLEQKKEVEDLKDKIKNEIVNKYYQLLKLQEKIKIKEKLLKQNKTNLKMVKAKVQAGEVLRLDQKEAELEVEENKLNLNQLRKEYELALARLSKKINVELTPDIKLVEVKLKTFAKDKSNLKAKVYQKDMKLKVLRKKLEQKQYHRKELNGNQNLDLKLLGSFGWGKNIEPETDYRVGVQVNYNFNNYQSKVDDKNREETELKVDSLKEKLAENKENLKLKIDEMFLALRNYKEKSKFYKKRIKKAKKRVEIAETRYKAGRTTISDLLDKELNLRQRQIDYVNTVINYNQQVYQLNNLIN